MAASLGHAITYKRPIAGKCQLVAVISRRRSPANEYVVNFRRQPGLVKQRLNLARHYRQQVDTVYVVGDTDNIAYRQFDKSALRLASPYNHHFPGNIVGRQRRGQHRIRINTEICIGGAGRHAHIFFQEAYIFRHARRTRSMRPDIYGV